VLDPKGYPLAQVTDGIIALFTRRSGSPRL